LADEVAGIFLGQNAALDETVNEIERDVL